MLKKLENVVVTEPTWLTHDVEIVESCVKNYFLAHDNGSHDINHVYRVVNLSMIIGKTEKNLTFNDAQLICLTALLHDIYDHKYCESISVRNDHLERILQNFDESVKNRVIDAVNKVSWSYEKKNPNSGKLALELICVRDSDRLDAIGAVGIARCFCYGGEQKRSLKKSREHFNEKLLKIHERLNTNYAKNIASERQQIMVDFCESYDKEINQDSVLH